MLFPIHNSSNLSYKIKDLSCSWKIKPSPWKYSIPPYSQSSESERERETDGNNLLLCAWHSLNVKRGFSRTEKVAVVMTALGSPGTAQIFISSLQQFCAKGTALPVCMPTGEPGECLLVTPPWFYSASFPTLAL